MATCRPEIGWKHALPRTVLAAFLAALGLLVSACGSAAIQSSATPTDSLPNIQHVSLGAFQASDLLPLAHGLVLIGTPGAVGNANDVPPEHGGQVTALYYYDFATRVVQPLVTLPSTPPKMIDEVTAAGDWVVYSTSPRPYEPDSLDDLWAVNAVTHEQRAVATSSDTSGYVSVFTTDGKVIVWVSYLKDQQELYTYDLRTRRTQIDGTATDLYPFYELTFPLVVDGETILYSRESNSSVPDPDQDGMYLWQSPASKPQHISPVVSRHARMNGQYAFWDDIQTQSVALYDRQKGTVTNGWEPSCIRPDLSADGAYIACTDYTHNLAVLVRVPSGTRTILGRTVTDASGAIVDGHVYWLAQVSVTPFSNVLNSWALPTA